MCFESVCSISLNTSILEIEIFCVEDTTTPRIRATNWIVYVPIGFGLYRFFGGVYIVSLTEFCVYNLLLFGGDVVVRVLLVVVCCCCFLTFFVVWRLWGLFR